MNCVSSKGMDAMVEILVLRTQWAYRLGILRPIWQFLQCQGIYQFHSTSSRGFTCMTDTFATSLSWRCVCGGLPYTHSPYTTHFLGNWRKSRKQNKKKKNINHHLGSYSFYPSFLPIVPYSSLGILDFGCHSLWSVSHFPKWHYPRPLRPPCQQQPRESSPTTNPP